MPRISYRLTLIQLGVLAACNVQAQTPPPATATVSVRGTADSMRRNDTAARIVIGREEIVKYGDTSVLEVMKRLPGVTVSGTDVRIRGLGNGYTQILVDGERQPAGFSLESLAPESIERIEVMRAATAEFSTQAVAGTINIVRKRRASTDPMQVKASIASVPDGRPGSMNLDISDKRDIFSYTAGARFNLRDSEFDSFELAEEFASNGGLRARRLNHTIGETWLKTLNFSPRLDWKLADNGSLSWQTIANRIDFQNIFDERTDTMAGPRYPHPRLDVRSGGDSKNLRTSVNWIARFGESGRLDTKASAYIADSYLFMYRVGRNDGDSVVLDRDYLTDSADRGLTWTGKLSFSWTEKHALAVGWDTGHTTYDERERQAETIAADSGPDGFDRSFDASIASIALFVQDEWDITPALSLYLGARWEAVGIRTRAVDFDRESSSRVLSPTMQMRWKIPAASNQQLRFALSRTFKAPGLRRLIPRKFATTFNTAVSPDFTGNPDLKPELAIGVDAAYELFGANGAMVSASVSARRIEGLLRSAVRFDGARWVSYPANSGEALVRGLELEAKIPLTSVFAGAPAIDLRASASGNWSRVGEVPGPDNRLGGQNPWSANLGADYKRGAVSAGASLSLVAGGWTRLSLAEWSYVSQRRDLDAYAAYTFKPGRQLRVTFTNVMGTDRHRSTRYTDTRGSLESNTHDPLRAGWRVQYEHKF